MWRNGSAQHAALRRASAEKSSENNGVVSSYENKRSNQRGECMKYQWQRRQRKKHRRGEENGGEKCIEKHRKKESQVTLAIMKNNGSSVA